METIIGISASILTALSLIPQLVKLLKEKKAEDVSMGMMIALFTGLALWTWYGFMRSDLIIIISNSFSLIINFSVGILTMKYKSNPRSN